MMDMIERVARSLYGLYKQDFPDAEFSGGVESYFMKRARAAIEAMRGSCNNRMVIALWAGIESDRSAHEIWDAMIDAALAETTPGALSSD